MPFAGLTGKDEGMEPDPRNLLPEQFRENWIVTPKDFPYQVFLVGLLLGAMLSLEVVALLFNYRELHLWGGVLLLLIPLQNLLPWPHKKIERELEEMKRGD